MVMAHGSSSRLFARNTDRVSGRSIQADEVFAWSTPNNPPERRTALVIRELQGYQVDIAALSETRFLDKGQLSEVGSGYTIYWSSHKAERNAGVGFAVRTPLVYQLESQPQGINDRIMTMRFLLSDNATKRFGLTINIKKTELMLQLKREQICLKQRLTWKQYFLFQQSQ